MKFLSVFLAAASFMLVGDGYGQITLGTGGSVAMGPAVSQLYKLRAECSATTNCGAGAPSRYGVYGLAEAGVNNYGVYGNATGGLTNYGVRGAASGGTTNWAGYFTGPVYISGTTYPSDERLKDDVRSLSETGALAGIMSLQPRSYRYRKNTTQDRLGLPEGEHFGLIAQELEKVFPQLVTDVVQPPETDEEGNELEPAFTFKGINYTELIPLLIQAVQEQQARIEALEAAVGEK